MEAILKALQGALPFLVQYPSWVRVCAALWVLASAGMFAVLLLAPRSAPTPNAGAATGQVQGGQGNLQAGRDLTVINHGERKVDAVLEVTQIGFTFDAEFDVMVRNLGDTDLIIHEITVKKLQAPGISVMPVLKPTAKYHLPVDDIPLGGTKSLSVSQVVPARSADRFLIALETTTLYLLEVTLHYNRDQAVSFTKGTFT
jgi:hypothetical protein